MRERNVIPAPVVLLVNVTLVFNRKVALASFVFVCVVKSNRGGEERRGEERRGEERRGEERRGEERREVFNIIIEITTTYCGNNQRDPTGTFLFLYLFKNNISRIGY
jgi:hypothetical protein